MGALLSFLLQSLAFFLALLPRRIFFIFAGLIGSLLYLLGFRKQVVMDNVTLAYPTMSTEEKQKLLRDNYRHYGILFLELLRFFSRFDRFLEKECSVEGEENLRQALAKGRGVLILTAHISNWEVIVGYGSHVLKVPATMVTKQLKPKWLHDLSERTRARLGTKMAFEPKTLRVVLKSLQRGEIVGFVMDQYTGAPVGARVPFFGIPVGSHTALATLALRTKAAVVPGFAYRLPDGKYRVRFEPEIPLIENNENLELAVLQNTANYVRRTESWVREFPEQWLWIHKRWKGDLSPLAPNIIGEILK